MPQDCAASKRALMPLQASEPQKATVACATLLVCWWLELHPTLPCFHSFTPNNSSSSSSSSSNSNSSFRVIRAPTNPLLLPPLVEVAVEK
jgi:hypothetical protein